MSGAVRALLQRAAATLPPSSSVPAPSSPSSNTSPPPSTQATPSSPSSSVPPHSDLLTAWRCPPPSHLPLLIFTCQHDQIGYILAGIWNSETSIPFPLWCFLVFSCICSYVIQLLV
ncbi:hypothetical protein BRADI_3g09785v3 [Brachypodium distachyon]|uniref:Uncharacterized protein n=1 Tax=Brachypodium distachyon TaxID=15368 RepID=A0A0Q3F7X0_BRADI|nr:hypothetical protein BRADI_3g09785v3 [Brachypodium distachyon]